MGIEDLKQEALFALQRAAEDYDPSKETKFSTPAVTYIRNRFKTLTTLANAEKRADTPVSLDKMVEGKKSREEPLVAKIEETRPIGQQSTELRQNFIGIIKGLRISEKKKAIFIDLMGLEDGRPKGVTETGRRWDVPHSYVSYVRGEIIKKLKKHPRMQQFRGIV